MYPITCAGGFPVPTKSGKFEICGFYAKVDDATANSQLVLVDDQGIDQSLQIGRVLTSFTPSTKTVIANIAGLANIDTYLACEFAEPVKVRNGLSVYTQNLEAGSVCVYYR